MVEVVINPTIVIPKTLTEYMKRLGEELERKYGDIEYSVLVKAEIKGNRIIVKPEVYIPYQKASYAFIEYDHLEMDFALYRQGFNVVIHKHPTGISHFSSTDYSSINQIFPVSILFENKQWREATVMVNGIDNRKYVFRVDRIKEVDTGEEVKVHGDPSKINDPEFIRALEQIH